MRSGPVAKGPRLWLQPERKNANGSVEVSRWVIRDGPVKRSTGCPPDDVGGAEQALARYIAKKHQPPKRRSDPSETLTADVLNLYARDIVPGHSRPKETTSRIKRLASWWVQPAHAMRTMVEMDRPVTRMTGHVSDVCTATCQAYAQHVGAQRSASMDLELLRAAINYAVKEQVLDRSVPVALPPKSLPRERWLTRSEVAHLVWLAWRGRRAKNGRSGGEDAYMPRKHLARFMLMAHYTGTRKTAILNACFKRQFGRGFIDVENGLWYRRGEGVRATKKRQPPVPLPLPLLAHLRRWQKNGQEFAVEYNGKPVDRIDKAFRQLVEDSGLEGEIVPHTFRHTAITWGMQRGIDPWDASGYFGVSMQVLIDVYGHHHPNHLRDAASKMARPDRNSVGNPVGAKKPDLRRGPA